MSTARWPTLTNVQRYDKAILNMEPPEESWTNIPVIKVIAKDSSYEKAKVKLKDAEILTDFEEDSDIRADKLKRSRKTRARISTSSCDEEEFDGKEVQLDPFPHPPQTINSKNNSFISSYKAKKEDAVLIKNGNQCLAVNDATQITNDIPVFSKSPCTSQSMPAKRKLPNKPNYASKIGSINLQNALQNKYTRKNTEFAGNKNSNNSSTAVCHIYSHAAVKQATNVMTSEPALNIDDSIIFDFPEFEYQIGNASASIDSPSRTSNDPSLKVFQRFVVRTLTNIKFDIQNLRREVKAIKKESLAALNRKFENDQLEEEKENVLINLPLKTIDGDLRELEENLTNKEYRNQAIKEFQQTGGKTLKNMSLQLMRKLFSDDLANQFSWVGGKKKEVFSDLRICKVILYVVSKRFTGATEDDIAEPIKTWLAHAKERAYRTKNKK